MISIVILIYGGIAAGCESAGWGFWKSLCWPGAVGRMIVKAAPGEDSQP